LPPWHTVKMKLHKETQDHQELVVHQELEELPEL